MATARAATSQGAEARRQSCVALQTGKFRDATKQLILALAVWPFLMVDRRILLAIPALIAREPAGPPVPEVWPEWEE